MWLSAGLEAIRLPANRRPAECRRVPVTKPNLKCPLARAFFVFRVEKASNVAFGGTRSDLPAGESQMMSAWFRFTTQSQYKIGKQLIQFAAHQSEIAIQFFIFVLRIGLLSQHI